MDQDDKGAEAEHRKNIQRYRYLFDFVRDPELRGILKKLLREEQGRVSGIRSRQREY